MLMRLILLLSIFTSLQSAPKAFDSLGNELEIFNEDCIVNLEMTLSKHDAHKKCIIFNRKLKYAFKLGYKIDPFIEDSHIDEKIVGRYLSLLRELEDIKAETARYDYDDISEDDDEYYGQLIVKNHKPSASLDLTFIRHYEEEYQPTIQIEEDDYQEVIDIPDNTIHTAPLDGQHKKTIYLTFDDGPLRNTPTILSIIKKEMIEVTMFLVGEHINMRKRVFNAILKNPYITVANHTHTHAHGKYRKFYSNKKRLLRDIQKCDKILQGKDKSKRFPLRLAGRNVFRLSYISSDDYGLTKKQRVLEHLKYDMIREQGFNIYGWDIEWTFNHKNGSPLISSKNMYKKIESLNSRKKSKKINKVILLMHDFMFKNGRQKELIKLIRLLKNSGWSFESIEKY